MRKVSQTIIRLLGWTIVWASLTLLIAGLGIRGLFGKVSIDQLVLNLVAVQTAGGWGSGLLWFGIIGIGVLPLAMTVALALWNAKRRARHQREGVPYRGPRRFQRILAAVMIAGVVVTGTSAFRSAVLLDAYVDAGRSNLDIGDYYTQPVITDDSQKRNLITVYLESAEDALADDTLFEKNMYASLDDATATWDSIEDFRQYPGGGWTMAGIVATQCGIPLKGKGAVSSRAVLQELVTGMDSYLASVTCLGDVLAGHGFQNVFLSGADTEFAAKSTFLSDHGYVQEYGLTDWQDAGEATADIRSDWGLSDARLMEHAKTQVTQLHRSAQQEGQPFHLSILTLDTHEPAHVYDTCEVDTEEEMTAVYACSMEAVAGFIDYLDEAGYLEDTSVVIMGDHLKQLGGVRSFYDELAGRTDRTIYNRVWMPEGAPELRVGADQLSMYATLLEAAGLVVQDHTAGIGVSAFTDVIPSDSAVALERSVYTSLLRSRSDDFYREAWGG